MAQHIIGYNIRCKGLSSPDAVSGDNFDECLRKFRNYYDCDYDVDTNVILSAEPITVEFDIEN